MRPRGWLRMASLGLLSSGALVTAIVLAYELARARVPEYRAALERLVTAQTGLDVRFNELGLRWGWYGPEAVFRRVELGEPGRPNRLLRAPELVIGFDAWRTLRSGQPEAGRITLVAPDIDFATEAQDVSLPPRARDVPPLDPVRTLLRWRGGRIDIEGGTLRLPGRVGSVSDFTIQVRRASLRRSDDEWSVFALVFLPERLGRTARVVARLAGDLRKPATLDGSLRLDAQRVSFAGCRELVGLAQPIAQYLPLAGGGDLVVDVTFERGHVVKASGSVRAGGLVFDGGLALERLRAEWRLARRGSDWLLRAHSLELGRPETPASLSLDAGPSGEWVRGSLAGAPLESVVALARWLSPHLQLGGVGLSGSARRVVFDWDPSRPDGDRLRTSAQLEGMAIEPPSHAFIVSGLDGQVVGSESQWEAELHAPRAQLELARSRQYPLEVRIASKLQIRATEEGWRLTAQELHVEHQHAVLTLRGSLVGRASPAEDIQIVARGSVTGADITFLERALGEDSARSFAAAGLRLTGGRIDSAQFELHGPADALLLSRHGEGFTGSATVRDAILSGSDLWPDAEGLVAQVDWRGARIHATVHSGHAGAFQLAAGRADWDASGVHAMQLTGRVRGRLEDAIAWIRTHRQLQQYVPDMRDVSAHGNAEFDFNVSVPGRESDATVRAGQSAVQARVATFVDGMELLPLAGMPPVEGISGAIALDTGRLQRSTLTGTWFGGPVVLRIAEQRDQGTRAFVVQARGTLDARQLADAVASSATSGDATSEVQGKTEWQSELVYLPGSPSQPVRWRVRADSNLASVSSSLPEPFSKRPGSALPLHIEASGSEEAAQMRVSLGDRLRSAWLLHRRPEAGWAVDRGTLRLGSAAVSPPSEPVVSIQGHLSRLDLPAYLLAYQLLRRDLAPPLQAQLSASQMIVAGHTYADVTLQARRVSDATELQLESTAFQGHARWPNPAAHPAPSTADGSAELRFSRLELSDTAAPGEGLGWIGGITSSAQLSVDDLIWQDHPIGRLTATLAARGAVIFLEDAELAGDTHHAHGSMQCEIQSAKCRSNFTLDSTDAAATLSHFGFRPNMTASRATLRGELEWRVGTRPSWIAGLAGSLSLQLAEGATRTRPSQGRPFALLAVPALVSGLDEPHDLRFTRLEAQFQLHDGQAITSSLHLDGDAEILMRGRTGLVARDYDQQVWVLRGGERLPAALRRFGATPRVAATWLSLRELVAGNAGEGPSRLTLHLQGSWDDPIVAVVR